MKIIRLVLFITLLVILQFVFGCCKQEKIPGLIEQLDSTAAHDRSQAAYDLAGCGSKASRAVSRLAELIYDENVGVQSAAAYALRKIDTPEARRIMEEVQTRKGK